MSESDTTVARLEILMPHQESLNKVGSLIVNEAKALVVDSQSMYEICSEGLANIKSSKAKLEAQLKTLTDPARAIEKAARDLFRQTLGDHDDAELVLKSKMGGWIKQVEAKRAAEQAEAEAAARREAQLAREAAEAQRREAEKIRAAAESERVAAEAKAKAEADAMAERARAAEAAGNAAEAAAMQVEAARQAQAAEAEALRVAEAREADARRLDDAASAQATMAAITVAAPPVTATPKATGASDRKTLVAVVDDLAAAQRWVADHREYAHLLELRMGDLNRVGNATKGALVIPGIRWTEEVIISQRKK